MADSGVSSQLTKLRLYEVYRAYRRAFGWLWFSLLFCATSGAL